jgi:hypothetical protein
VPVLSCLVVLRAQADSNLTSLRKQLGTAAGGGETVNSGSRKMIALNDLAKPFKPRRALDELIAKASLILAEVRERRPKSLAAGRRSDLPCGEPAFGCPGPPPSGG